MALTILRQLARAADVHLLHRGGEDGVINYYGTQISIHLHHTDLEIATHCPSSDPSNQ